jgi:predicted nucleic-acid-binding protein
MRVGLDTSVVLRLLIGEPHRQAERAWRSIVEARLAGDKTVVSDLVVSEAYFALQHHYSVPKSAALKQLQILLDSGDVSAAGCAGSVLKVPHLANAKPGFVDRLIHDGYVAADIDRVLTFEKAAGKLPHARVLTA